MPCTSVFECAGEHELGQSIFVDEDEDGGWGDLEVITPIVPAESAPTSSAQSDTTSTSLTRGQVDLLPHSAQATLEDLPTTVEGEVTSARETSRHIH